MKPGTTRREWIKLTLLSSAALPLGGCRSCREPAKSRDWFEILEALRQAVRESPDHLPALAEKLVSSDPQVIARLQGGAQLLSGSIPDPAQQSALGGVLLAQAQAREAAVLAFNDVFRFVSWLGIATALFLSILVLRDFLRARNFFFREVRA